MTDITTTGRIDEQFGTATLAVGVHGAIDETFGVSQAIEGGLVEYYGPLATPLIADAPYSHVYGDTLTVTANTQAMSKSLVPEQRIPAPSNKEPIKISDKLVVPPYSVPDMGYSRYKFVITDMKGRIQGEVLQCQQKTLTQVLDNMCTASFTVYLNNPMIDYILHNECLCKVYRQPVDRRFAYRLMLVGDLCTEEEDTSGDTGTMTFTVVDPLNRMAYRMIGKELENSHGKGFTVGTPTNEKDIADTIGAMLDEVNDDTLLGRCGVTLGIRGPNTPSTYMSAVYFTPFATQLQLYTDTVAGVDFYMEPQEPYSYSHYPGVPGTNPYQTGGPPKGTPPESIVLGTTVADTVIAKMNVYAPMGNFLQSPGPPGVYSKGRPYPVFEYGTGKHNVQGYQRLRDRSKLTNMWWNLPDGFPSSNSATDPVIHTALDVQTTDGTVEQSIYRRGGFEQVDTGSLGANTGKLRQLLVNSDAQTTASTQEQITFTPVIDCDEDWTIDYFLGDVCTVRAFVKEANNGAGAWRFNGTMRIYGISATADENDLEQISITTINPASSGISAP